MIEKRSLRILLWFPLASGILVTLGTLIDTYDNYAKVVSITLLVLTALIFQRTYRPLSILLAVTLLCLIHFSWVQHLGYPSEVLGLVQMPMMFGQTISFVTGGFIGFVSVVIIVLGLVVDLI